MIRAVLLLLLLAANTLAEDTRSIVYLDGSQSSAVVVKHVRSDKTGHLALVATANHALKPGVASLSLIFSGGKRSKVDIAAVDIAHDVALLWAWCPDDTQPIAIADTASMLPELNRAYQPSGKLKATFHGFRDGKLLSTAGSPSFRDNGYIVSDAIISPGLSGGAMIVDGKLFGIIIGGWAADSDDKSVVWPAQCADAALLGPLIDKAMKDGPKR